MTNLFINFSKENCQEWLNNKNINPKTGRFITTNGPTFLKIENICKNYNLDSNTNDQEIFSIKYRYSIFKKMRKLFKNKDIEKKCSDELIGDIFDNDVRLIGSGTFGKVTIVSPKKVNFEIALKEAKIDYKEFTRFKSNNLNEQVILPLLTKKVLNNIIQNFPIVYHMNLCVLKNSGEKKQNRRIDIYLEKMDGSIDKIIYSESISNNLLKNIFFQCFISLAAAQHFFGLIHTDIKSQNFLYKITKPGGYWIYNFRGDKYYIKNLGYIVFLNDFGLSYFSKPKYAFKDDYNVKLYGNRPIIINTIGTEKNIEIIDYKYNISISQKSNKIKLINDTSIYGAIGTDKYDLEPNIELDYNNLDMFPPIEFMKDNIDLIRIFIGGKRTMQYGNHPSTNIRDKKLLESITKDSNLSSIIKNNKSYIFSCKDLMKIIFNNFSREINNSYLIDTFYIEDKI